MKAFKNIVFFVMFTLILGCQENSLLSIHSTVNEPIKNNLIELQFWTPFTGGDESFMDEIVKRYNSENTEHVYIKLKQFKSDEYYTRLITAIVTESAPEIAIVHSSKYAQYMPASFFNDISVTAKKLNIDWSEYNQNILSSTVVEGKHYGIPLDTHFTVMYYNKLLLKKAGLLGPNGLPQINPGKEGYLEFLQQLKTRLPDNIDPLSIPDSRIDSLWLWWSLYNQMDTSTGLIDKATRQNILHEENALEVLSFIESLKTKAYIPTDVENHLTHFADGHAATLLWGIWAVGLLNHNHELDLGIIPLPKIYDNQAVWGDSHTFAFPLQETQNQTTLELAIKFSSWVANHSEGWGEAGHVPAVTKVSQSEAFQALPYRAMYSPVANDVKYFPSHPNMTQITGQMYKEMESMLGGRKAPEDVVYRFNEIIDEFTKE